LILLGIIGALGQKLGWRIVRADKTSILTPAVHSPVSWT
jgi:hypothetical protein